MRSMSGSASGKGRSARARSEVGRQRGPGRTGGRRAARMVAAPACRGRCGGGRAHLGRRGAVRVLALALGEAREDLGRALALRHAAQWALVHVAHRQHDCRKQGRKRKYMLLGQLPERSTRISAASRLASPPPQGAPRPPLGGRLPTSPAGLTLSSTTSRLARSYTSVCAAAPPTRGPPAVYLPRLGRWPASGCVTHSLMRYTHARLACCEVRYPPCAGQARCSEVRYYAGTAHGRSCTGQAPRGSGTAQVRYPSRAAGRADRRHGAAWHGVAWRAPSGPSCDPSCEGAGGRAGSPGQKKHPRPRPARAHPP